MDPSNRLWNELIFIPWCAQLTTLLALRLCCRSWRTLLSTSRAWLAALAALDCMRHDERVLGWPGVVHAMEREQRTRANVDAGRYTRMPALSIPTAHWGSIIAGRLVLGGKSFVNVVGVCVVPVNLSYFCTSSILCDRWLPCVLSDDTICLFDCVTTQFTPALMDGIKSRNHTITASGQHISIRSRGDPRGDVVRVLRITTEVACIAMPNLHAQFALCESGCSYLLYGDTQQLEVNLYDLRTQQKKRTLHPPAGHVFRNYGSLFDCAGYVSLIVSLSTYRLAKIVYRLADGHHTGAISRDYVLPCKGNRVCIRGSHIGRLHGYIMDADTGAELSDNVDVCDPVVWHDGNDRNIFVGRPGGVAQTRHI